MREHMPPTSAGPRGYVHRAGLTLIELMAALVILGGLSAVIVPWMQTVARLHTEEAPIQVWSTHVERFFALIQRDLDVGDFSPTNERARRGDHSSVRVSLSEDGRSLRIRTREPKIGRIVHIYEFDRWNERVHRRNDHDDDATRLVLTKVHDWRCTLQPALVRRTNSYDESPWMILTIQISGPDGITRQREFLLSS